MVERASVLEVVHMPDASTIAGIAKNLGVGIEPTHDPQSELRSVISPDVRAAMGYGDLPDDLIRRVELEVTYGIPDHLGGDKAALRLAAQTMRLISESPDIEASTLREQLDPGAAGIQPGSSLAPSTLATYQGAIAIAEHLARKHFVPTPERSMNGSSN